MITAEQIRKSHDGTHILEGVTFAARPGELSVLTGDNGAGKSTTLKILAGLARADSGLASIDGIDIARQRRKAQARLSFLPQGTNFQPAMTPWQLMRFYAGIRGVPKNRIEPLLREVDLWDARNKAAGKLSGGMLQRLGVALLLLPDAPVLILDEPGISLDPGWRDWLREALEEQAAAGKTILITTHLIAEWEGCADQMFVCRDGRVFQAGRASRLHPESAGGAGGAPSGTGAASAGDDDISARTDLIPAAPGVSPGATGALPVLPAPDKNFRPPPVTNRPALTRPRGGRDPRGVLVSK